MHIEKLMSFIKERHKIYLLKKSGKSGPWTEDKILQKYRFCNVYRELDVQTIWFAKNWREPNKMSAELWFASMVFRLTNWHETAQDIGYPLPWNKKHFIEVMGRRKHQGQRLYNPAYIISTHGNMLGKHLYLAEVLDAAWKEVCRGAVSVKHGYTLEAVHSRLMRLRGLGSFLAAQIVADIKYTPWLENSNDWWTFAASGPGSRRGLNRVLGREVNSSWVEPGWQQELASLRTAVNPLIEDADMDYLHAQDLQNCLCEFDKYERVRLGEGTPNQIYKGAIQ